MNNKIYNNLVLNILFFNHSNNNTKYLNKSIELLNNIKIKELDSYKSIFPLINCNKLISNFIKEVGFNHE
jgi:hypothetical protein